MDDRPQAGAVTLTWSPLSFHLPGDHDQQSHAGFHGTNYESAITIKGNGFRVDIAARGISAGVYGRAVYLAASPEEAKKWAGRAGEDHALVSATVHGELLEMKNARGVIDMNTPNDVPASVRPQLTKQMRENMDEINAKNKSVITQVQAEFPDAKKTNSLFGSPFDGVRAKKSDGSTDYPTIAAGNAANTRVKELGFVHNTEALNTAFKEAVTTLGYTGIKVTYHKDAYPMEGERQRSPHIIVFDPSHVTIDNVERFALTSEAVHKVYIVVPQSAVHAPPELFHLPGQHDQVSHAGDTSSEPRADWRASADAAARYTEWLTRHPEASLPFRPEEYHGPGDYGQFYGLVELHTPELLPPSVTRLHLPGSHDQQDHGGDRRASTIEQKLIDKFGLTNRPELAGFMLSDGTMIDLRRDDEGAGFIPHSTATHNARVGAIQDVMAAGIVRMDFKTDVAELDVNFTQPLTDAQITALARIAAKDVYVDLSDFGIDQQFPDTPRSTSFELHDYPNEPQVRHLLRSANATLTALSAAVYAFTPADFSPLRFAFTPEMLHLPGQHDQDDHAGDRGDGDKFQEQLDRAVNQFGITDRPEAAGFMLPDGRMLDLKRDTDDPMVHTEAGGSAGLDGLMTAGAVRMTYHPDNGELDVHFTAVLSDEQISSLSRIPAKDVYVDAGADTSAYDQMWGRGPGSAPEEFLASATSELHDYPSPEQVRAVLREANDRVKNEIAMSGSAFIWDPIDFSPLRFAFTPELLHLPGMHDQESHGGEDSQAGSLATLVQGVDVSDGKLHTLGPVQVLAYRTGPLTDVKGRGVFFGDTQDSVGPYRSLHGEAPVIAYKINAQNALMITNQFALHKELFNGKTFQDAVWLEDKKSGFTSSIKATRIVEGKLASKARAMGYDAIIYTAPPAPAAHEIAVIKDTALIVEQDDDERSVTAALRLHLPGEHDQESHAGDDAAPVDSAVARVAQGEVERLRDALTEVTELQPRGHGIMLIDGTLLELPTQPRDRVAIDDALGTSATSIAIMSGSGSVEVEMNQYGQYEVTSYAPASQAQLAALKEMIPEDVEVTIHFVDNDSTYAPDPIEGYKDDLDRITNYWKPAVEIPEPVSIDRAPNAAVLLASSKTDGVTELGSDSSSVVLVGRMALADGTDVPVIIKPERGSQSVDSIRPSNYVDAIARGEEPSQIAHEVAASLLASSLGLNAPHVAELDASTMEAGRSPGDDVINVLGGPASVQPMVEGEEVEMSQIIANVDIEQVRDVALFDQLINNTDRHMGNVLLDGDQLVMIDHGLAFADNEGHGGNTKFVDLFQAGGSLSDQPSATLSERQTRMLGNLVNNEATLKEQLLPLLGETRTTDVFDRARKLLTLGRIANWNESFTLRLHLPGQHDQQSHGGQAGAEHEGAIVKLPKSLLDHTAMRAAEKLAAEPSSTDWTTIKEGVNLRAERAGLSTAEYVKQAEEHLRKIMIEAVPMVRVPAAAMLQILEDGRFKSQYESKQSSPGGLYSPKYRREAETEMFGERPEFGKRNAERAPIYGYFMEDTTTLDTDHAYGNVRVVLNDDVKERATVYGYDSLGMNGAPSPALAPAIASVIGMYSNPEEKNSPDPIRFETFKDWRTVGNTPYIEAQYHGGLRVSDIKEVQLEPPKEPRHARHAYDAPGWGTRREREKEWAYFDRQTVAMQTLEDRLKAAGIPYS